MNCLRRQILRHTMPSRRHLTPELVLRLITPECALWSAPVDNSPFRDPFWAFYWPGGQATARYILDNAHVVKNRRVLDVGCGCGAGAIAASIMKAKLVVANDIDPCAIFASKINSDLNKTIFQTDTNNFIGKKCEEFDTILIGDMFYDEQFGEVLFKWLRTLAAQDKLVLIGDPGRHGLTTERQGQMSLVAKYDLPAEIRLENHGFTETALWMLNKP